MRINSVVVENYKSYSGPTAIKLTSGFNCIVGQNDVGKTALLEAISLRLTNHPHRSVARRPDGTELIDPSSRVVVDFSLSRTELIQAIKSVHSFSIPVGRNEKPQEYREIAQSFIDNVLEDNVFRVRYQHDGFFEGQLNDYIAHPETTYCTYVGWTGNDFAIADSYGSVNVEQQFSSAIGNYLKSRIFQFKAERFRAGRSAFGIDTTLRSDAGNLPQVLSTMQGNPMRMQRLSRYISAIFPHIAQVSVRNVAGENPLEIVVWPLESGEREDVAVPLTESGTGISQVLAILVVVLAAESPQTIIIDEPQSFLHPGAARKLIELLRQHDEHQFIVATHSPTIIAAAEPNTITLVRKTGSVSTLYPISKDTRSDLDTLFHDVGVRLSDVFGADRVLWVEGKTEELCFPLITRCLLDIPLMGTVILGLSSTGALEGRHADLIFDLYRRLSGSTGLLPPAVAFILDREMRTEEQRQAYTRRSGAPVGFLGRRSYENYLVHPAAIAHILSTHLGEEVSAAVVHEWLEEHRWDGRWCRDITATPQTMELWNTQVDAPRLLERLFESLSMHRVVYRKTHHSVDITRWLLQNDPEQLTEVAELLRTFLRAEGSPGMYS